MYPATPLQNARKRIGRTSATGKSNAVNLARHANAQARTGRKVDEALLATGVVAVRLRENPIHRQRQAFLQPGIRTRHTLRFNLPKQGSGQIATASARIFCNVPGDIGQLHSDTEIDGEGIGRGIPDAEHTAHQQPYGTRNPVAVAVQLDLISDSDVSQVGAYASDQFESRPGVHVAAASQVEEIGGDQVTSRLSCQHFVGSIQALKGRGLVCRLVGNIVNMTAEAVKPCATLGGGGIEQSTGEVKTAAVFG